jgi:hypothetical protein
MPRVHDLPESAISSIIQRARSRRIPGTNKFALVCQSWSSASSYAGDDEQLHLLLDLVELREQDLESSLAWLRQYGSCVTGMYISNIMEPSGCWPVLDQMLVTLQTFSSTLTHLELEGLDTLRSLAPLLRQLASLRHLSTSITYVDARDSAEASDHSFNMSEAAAPDLRQLCPHLVSLHLTMDPFWELQGVLYTTDTQLCSLLPVGLQQLHLTADYLVVDCRHLTELTALSALTLEVRDVEQPLELVGMSRLQQLRLWEPSLYGVDLVPLASKLACLWIPHHVDPPTMLQQLTGLTALAIKPLEAQFGQEEQPQANPLLSLTSLRHLHIFNGTWHDNIVCWMLDGISSIGSLRTLFVRGTLCEQALQLVGEVTQLTELGFLGGQLSATSQASLLKLSGLQRLTVDHTWVTAVNKELSTLQHLTELVVRHSPDRLDPLLLAPLSGLLPALQHVELRWSGGNWGQHQLLAKEMVPLPGVRTTFTHWKELRCQPTLHPRHTRPCPHLPGVQEVLPQVAT